MSPPQPVAKIRGLSVAPMECGWVLRVQPLGEVVWGDDFMRAQGELGEWEALSGAWKSAGPPLSRFHVNAFSLCGTADADSDAYILAGYDFWDDLAVSCSLRREEEKDAGLLLGAGSELCSAPFLARLSGEGGEGTVSLCRRRNNRWEPLAEARYPCLVGQWHRLHVTTEWNGVTVSVDRFPVLRTETDAVKAGRVGLWVGPGGKAAFDDVRVTDLDADLDANLDAGEARSRHLLSPRAFDGPFRDDPYMSKWSQERSFWTELQEGFEHTGLFSGTVSFSLAPPAELKPDAWAEFSFAAHPGKGSRDGILWKKRVGMEPSETRSWEGMAGTGSRLRVEGNWDPRPFLELESLSVRDYTFREAPADWFVLGGEWSVQSRWACTPRWNWFGGFGEERVGILHKEVFSGDCAVDAFCAFKMDSNFFPIYEHPGDINVSLCVRGTDLDSGYSFLYGGWGNQRTAIMKGTRVLAERDDLLLPDNRDRSQTVTEIHKPWYRVRAEKRGDLLRFFLEDRMVLEARDPSPLEGGRVALWSYEQGLMVARARLYGQAEAIPVFRGSAVPPNPPGRASFRGGESLRVGLWTTRSEGTSARPLRGSEEALWVLSPWGGGRMMVGPLTWNAREVHGSSLAFHYSASREALFHLYVKANDWWCCFPLTQGTTNLPGGIVLPQVKTQELDDGWFRCFVEMGKALRTVFPEEESIEVRDIVFGNMDNSQYEVCGFQWNRANANYTLHDLRWIPGKAVSSTRRSPPDTLSPLYSGRLHTGFEKGWDGVKGFGGKDGALLLRDVRDPAEGRFCLRIANPRLGGAAGIVLVDEPFCPRRFPCLLFQYKVGEDPRLDLVVETSSGERQIRFTDTDNTWPLIGTIEDVRRDSAWHRARAPLLDWLQGSFGEEPPIVHRILLVSTGWPGNRRDVNVWLDSLELEAALPVPESAETGLPTVQPVPGTAAMPERIEIQLQRGHSAVDPASLRWKICGKVYDLTDRCLSWDSKEARLVWDAHRSGQPLAAPKEGSVLEGSLHWACHPGSSRHARWSWRISRAKDRSSPPSPWVSVIPGDVLVRYDFEKDSATWGNFIHCRTLIHQRNPATGSSCLELRPLMPKTRVAAMIREMDYDVERYPLIQLEHRVEGPTVPAPLEMLGVAYDGNHDTWPLVKTISVGEDWQRTEMDLLSFIRAESVKNERFSFRRLSLGHRAGCEGQETLRYFVDNVCVAGRPVDRASFEWNSPPDLSGVKGYSVAIDRREDTVPRERVSHTGNAAEFQGGPGNWWFHIRAVDGAGNWSGTTHAPFDLGRG